MKLLDDAYDCKVGRYLLAIWWSYIYIFVAERGSALVEELWVEESEILERGEERRGG